MTGAPLEIERKFHVSPGADAAAMLAAADRAEIVQTYLRGRDGYQHRVRQLSRAGVTRFFHTAKRKVSTGVREEHEREIDAVEYRQLLAHADPQRQPIRKTRHVFQHAGLRFELDQLHQPCQLWLLEVELDDPARLDAPIDLPGWLIVHREVTDDPAFGNGALARTGDPAGTRTDP